MKTRCIAVATAVAALAVPAYAGAHATVTPFQPQGKALTSARTLYVVRVPNERADLDTYKVVLYVPAPVQESIRLKKKEGWRTVVTKKDTGKKDAEGGPVFAIQKVVWTARRGQAIEPLFFDDFFFRFQNPATPQKTCFWVHQFYGEPGSRKPKETVKWTGAEGTETPASCVSFVTS